MSYLTSQNDGTSGAVDFRPASATRLAAHQSVSTSSEKWPIAWTAWGLIAFCGAVWTALFNLLF